MLFWDLDFFGRSYMLPLTRSISENLRHHDVSFHLAYVDGEPQKDWNSFGTFHKMNLPKTSVKSKLINLFLSRDKLLTQIKNTKADAIFSPSEVWAQELARFCSKRMKIPYIVWLRGDHQKVRGVETKNWQKKTIINYIETRSLKKATLVIPCCEELEKRALSWGVQKDKLSKPVYNGVDTTMFKPTDVKRSQQFTLAYAGRISPEKGILRLIDLANKVNDIRIIAAGKKQMDISFPKNIEYFGTLTLSDMPHFYNSADLIILPSFTEGFANVILEAYACGKPVLVAKEAFPKELKVFGSVCNSENFASEIKKLQKLDLKAIGQEARLFVEKNYSWDVFGKQVAQHIKDSIDENKQLQTKLAAKQNWLNKISGKLH